MILYNQAISNSPWVNHVRYSSIPFTCTLILWQSKCAFLLQRKREHNGEQIKQLNKVEKIEWNQCDMRDLSYGRRRSQPHSNRKNVMKGVSEMLLWKLKIGGKRPAFQQMDFHEWSGNIVESNRRISFFIAKLSLWPTLTVRTDKPKCYLIVVPFTQWEDAARGI